MPNPGWLARETAAVLAWARWHQTTALPVLLRELRGVEVPPRPGELNAPSGPGAQHTNGEDA